MRKLKRPAAEFLRFVIVGLINTGITYVLYLQLLKTMNYMLAYSCTYVVGIVVSYVLNSFFVFRTQFSKKTALRFPLIYLLQYGWGSAFLWVLVQMLGMDKRIAMLLVIASSVLVTFFLLKKLFRTRTL